MSEGALQKLVLDWLQAKQILAFRMNTGMMKTEGRFIRFGVVGMADILAFPDGIMRDWKHFTQPTWIELKSKRGQQSEYQKSFQQQVEAAGHRYVLAKSLEDVQKAMEQ